MEGAMSSKNPEAHPLTGFRLGQSPDASNVAIVEMISPQGSNFYIVQKDTMKQMISWLQEMINTMPDTK